MEGFWTGFIVGLLVFGAIGALAALRTLNPRSEGDQRFLLGAGLALLAALGAGVVIFVWMVLSR